MSDLEITPNSALRQTPIINPAKTNFYLKKEMLDWLKKKAIEYDTTVSEVVRAILKKYIDESGELEEAKRVKTFFRIYYGIKEFNENGKEINCDTNEIELLYPTIDEARPIQMKFFDKMIEEMRRHPDDKRSFEQAFCYLEPVYYVTNSNPRGINAYDTLNKQARDRLSGAKLIFNGRDF